MTIETERRHANPWPVSSAASERRAEALIAAYIHELSPRHRAERESRENRVGRRRDSG